MVRYLGCLSVILGLVQLVICLTAIPVEAQQPVMRKIELKGEGGVFNLAELDAILVGDASGLKVEFMRAAEQRLEVYRSVDLKQGDRIVMVNGKKVAKADELQALYDALKPGEPVKMAVDREGKKMIISFAKADPKDLPKRQMMVKHEDDGPSGETKEIKRNLDIPDDFTNVTPVPSAGIILGEKDGQVSVVEILPHAIEGKRPDLQKGDVIAELAGAPVASAKDFEARFDAIELGKMVSVGVVRGGAKLTVEFTRVKSDAVIKIGGN